MVYFISVFRFGFLRLFFQHLTFFEGKHQEFEQTVAEVSGIWQMFVIVAFAAKFPMGMRRNFPIYCSQGLCSSLTPETPELIHSPTHPPIHLYTHLPTYPSICPPIHPFIHPSTHSSKPYLSICSLPSLSLAINNGRDETYCRVLAVGQWKNPGCYSLTYLLWDSVSLSVQWGSNMLYEVEGTGLSGLIKVLGN